MVALPQDRKQLFLLPVYSSHPQFLSVLPLKPLLILSTSFYYHWYVHIVQDIVLSCLCTNFLTGTF